MYIVSILCLHLVYTLQVMVIKPYGLSFQPPCTHVMPQNGCSISSVITVIVHEHTLMTQRPKVHIQKFTHTHARTHAHKITIPRVMIMFKSFDKNWWGDTVTLMWHPIIFQQHTTNHRSKQSSHIGHWPFTSCQCTFYMPFITMTGTKFLTRMIELQYLLVQFWSELLSNELSMFWLTSGACHITDYVTAL